MQRVSEKCLWEAGCSEKAAAGGGLIETLKTVVVVGGVDQVVMVIQQKVGVVWTAHVKCDHCQRQSTVCDAHCVQSALLRFFLHVFYMLLDICCVTSHLIHTDTSRFLCLRARVLLPVFALFAGPTDDEQRWGRHLSGLFRHDERGNEAVDTQEGYREMMR